MTNKELFTKLNGWSNKSLEHLTEQDKNTILGYVNWYTGGKGFIKADVLMEALCKAMGLEYDK